MVRGVNHVGFGIRTVWVPPGPSMVVRLKSWLPAMKFTFKKPSVAALGAVGSRSESAKLTRPVPHGHPFG